MKYLILLLLGFVAQIAVAQNNNEWIDYSKTYYKFRITKDGLYRINQATLQAAGLASAPAQNFQLWRHGKQVPIYVSNGSGTLSASDYIEFWGKTADGEMDTQLYKFAEYHQNRKYSLYDDTVSFYLTVNTTVSQNLRLVNSVNDVAGNTLPVTPNFMHTAGNHPKEKIHAGYSVVIGEYLQASAYDNGEGWSSNEIFNGSTYTPSPLTNLFPDLTATQPCVFRQGAAGFATNQRTITTRINGNTVLTHPLDYFNTNQYPSIPNAPFSTANFNVSVLSGGAANIVSTNSYQNADRYVIAFQEISYPRLFNFGNETNFEFSLPASAVGNYLEITNFNAGGSTPTLFDLTNGTRYVAVVNGAQFRFKLLPSSAARKLVLVGQSGSNINAISGLQSKVFTNFMVAANQWDYLILTSKYLHPTPGQATNAVEKYKAYRASAAGGGYNAKIMDVEDLYDQYAYGYNKHPLAIRNYLRQARNTFTVTPKHVFLVGRGTMYHEVKYFQGQPYMEQLNGVPTFGWPASDNLLTAEHGTSTATTPIGRIGAINEAEVESYLNKVKEYELNIASNNFTIANKLWMKNGTFVTGSSEPTLQSALDSYNNEYRNNWADTSFGGASNLFTKTAAGGVVPLTNTFMEQQWVSGHSMLEYFGHSSPSALEFNLNDPEAYSNQGKYPLMVINGCRAGDFFSYNPYRITTNNNASLSEKFTLTPNRGSIAFIASTSYGVVPYLHYFNKSFYKNGGVTNYGKTLGELLKQSNVDLLNVTGQSDFYGRMQVEQNLLQGDPGVKMNLQYPKPDYIAEDQTITINPSFISIAETQFSVKVKYYNLGKAINDSITVRVQRQLPDGSLILAETRRVKAAYYSDSLTFQLPIIPGRDKGNSKIIICLDSDSEVDEMSEANNCVTKDVVIFEDELRPVHPYNYAIVNTVPLKLVASTANPFAPNLSYNMEMDTTEKFNSSLKITQTVASSGGVIEFNPINTLLPNTVYYWRVSTVGAMPLRWNKFSFTYLPTDSAGFNQQHYYQKLNSTYTNMSLDSATRKLKFDTEGINITVRNGVWPQGAYEEGHYIISINQDPYIRGVSGVGQFITFSIFNNITGEPIKNGNVGQPGRYGSQAIAANGREWNFTFFTGSPSQRKLAAQFMDSIPDGFYVVVRNEIFETWFNYFGTPINTFAPEWSGDLPIYGVNGSLYHKLKNNGFSRIDSFNNTKAFIFTYKKNGISEFVPKDLVSDGVFDRIAINATFNVPKREGTITSPAFGPAKEWKEVHWRGTAEETTVGDTATLTLIGIRPNNQEDVLMTLTQAQLDHNISNINATTYPYIKLRLNNKDAKTATPWQVDYLRLNYKPVPEGIISPNISFSLKDTVDIGEQQTVRIAFKNVSNGAFDSLKIKLTVRNASGILYTFNVPKQKPLAPGEVLTLTHSFPTLDLTGINTLYVEFNPDNHQPEQFYFNNFMFKTFYVRPDGVNPLLDVTFDGIHILNKDIVSANPNITIKLKDDNRFFALDDTAGLKVQLRYPGENFLRNYNWNNDTLRFIAADLSTGENSATAEFKPRNLPDGEYELVVGGKDKSGNSSGNLQYKVLFQVINKEMISNVMNYPNPFSTSTAFVFTITGKEVPPQLKIEILTITGKVVREIRKEELGPLRVGRNITDFKWDGTDQFGNKLANGVYLYRVLNRGSNGFAIEQYKSENDNTDVYFKAGYGKMVILR